MAILILAGRVTKDPAFLRNGDALEPMAYELCQDIEMTPVRFEMERYAHWPNGAPSCILWIEESKITIDCYPEESYVEFLLHSCKSIPDPEWIREKITTKLGLLETAYHLLPDFNWRELAKEVKHATN